MKLFSQENTFLLSLLLAFGSIFCMELEPENKSFSELLHGQQMESYFSEEQLHRWCITEQKEAADFIKQGAIVIDNVIEGKHQKKSFDRKTYLHSIRSVIWFLYHFNPVFNNGTIVIDDPSNKIFNFLYHFVDQTTDESHRHPVTYSTNPFSYCRKSSHFPEEQKAFPHYGIDSRDDSNQYARYDLPHGCSHILFGQLPDNRMFIKPEKYGLHLYYDLAMHAKGACGSIGRKTIPSIFGTNDEQHHKKEHLPGWIRDKFREITAQRGIETNITTIKQLFELEEQHKGVFAKLIEQVNKKYDNADKRYGNEIVIDTLQLRNACTYYQMLKTKHEDTQCCKALYFESIKKDEEALKQLALLREKIKKRFSQ